MTWAASYLTRAGAAVALGDAQRGAGELAEVGLGPGLGGVDRRSRPTTEAQLLGTARVIASRARSARSRALAGVDVAQEQEELVAAEAGDEVALADGALERAGDGLERLVAAGVAELLVDLLEAVEVDRDDAEAAAGRDDLLHLRAQLLVQVAVVGQAGQRVGGGELLEALALMAEERDRAVEGVGDVAELAGADRGDARVEVALLEAAQALVQASAAR